MLQPCKIDRTRTIRTATIRQRAEDVLDAPCGPEVAGALSDLADMGLVIPGLGLNEGADDACYDVVGRDRGTRAYVLLDSAGIDVRATKGLDAAHLDYLDPALRQYGDAEESSSHVNCNGSAVAAADGPQPTSWAALATTDPDSNWLTRWIFSLSDHEMPKSMRSV